MSNLKNDCFVIFTFYLGHIYFPAWFLSRLYIWKIWVLRVSMTVAFIAMLGLQDVPHFSPSHQIYKHLLALIQIWKNMQHPRKPWAGILFLALCLSHPSCFFHMCDFAKSVPFRSESTFLNFATVARQSHHLPMNVLSSDLRPLPTEVSSALQSPDYEFLKSS